MKKTLVTALAIVLSAYLLFAEEKNTPMTTTAPAATPASTPASVPASAPKILFFGDSITQMGQEQQDGYVNLLRRRLAGDHVDVIGAGIGGHRVMNLEERFDADVLRKNPDIVVIFIGINDIYYAQNHLDWALGRYVDGMNRMIAALKNRNIVPVIVIPSVIGEKQAGDNPLDKELDRLAVLATDLGKKHHIPVIHVLKAFRDHLAENNPDNKHAGILTLDGIHLNQAGNALVADTMEPELRALLRANPNHITISISPNEYGHLFFPDTRATITLAGTRTDAVIRYTTDGKEPTKDSEQYRSPVALDKTTTIKAALFIQDKKTGETVSGTFEQLTPAKPETVDANTLEAGGLDCHTHHVDNDGIGVSRHYKTTATVHTPDKLENLNEYGMGIHGYIHIEKEGIYIFRLLSDYGGNLVFFGSAAGNDSFLANRDEKSPDRIDDAIGHLALTPGYYRIILGYSPKNRAQMLQLDWKPPGGGRFVPIPAERLFTEKAK